MDMAEGAPEGDHSEYVSQGSKQSPFEAAVNPFASYEAGKGLNPNGPETGVVVASEAPSGDFRKGSGAPEANMNTGNTRTGPDGGRTSGAGNDPDGDVIDGEVREEADNDGNKDQPKGEKEARENNYTWEEFSSRVRFVISSGTLDANRQRIVDELKSFGLRLENLFEVEMDTSEIWTTKEAGRKYLGSILDDIDNSVELDEEKEKFIVGGVGVSKDKLDGWIDEANAKKNGKKKEAKPNEPKPDSETKEEKKKRLEEEARRFLDRIKLTRGDDGVDDQSLGVWIGLHASNATEADYREVVIWRREIAQRKIDKDKREEAKRKDEEKKKQEKIEDDKIKSEDEQRKNKAKAAKQALAAVIRDRTGKDDIDGVALNRWLQLYGKDADETDRVLANALLDGIQTRRNSLDAQSQQEKDQKDAQEKIDKVKRDQCLRMWRDLRDDSRRSGADIALKNEWMHDVRFFIKAYEDEDSDMQIVNTVEMARKDIKEVGDNLNKEICSNTWKSLSKELKETYPGTSDRGACIEKIKTFIAYYENSVDSHILGIVTQAKDALKVAEADQFGTGGNLLKFLYTTFFLPSVVTGKTGILDKFWKWTDSFAPKK